MKYEDYLKLNQWQRLFRILCYWKYKGYRLGWCAIWQYNDDYVSPEYWWFPKYWRWGFNTTQNDDRLYLGLVCILFCYK